MPSFLLTVFILQLVIFLFNTVAAAATNDLLWVLYNKLPTPSSKNVRQQTQLRHDVMRLKREMNGTSSQDEFAKWARLRRQHDKAMADYSAKTQALESFKSSFNKTVNTVRWTSTNGLSLFLQFWYAKKPLFWLPKYWVPWYIEWISAFPMAPMGSVSISTWSLACTTVVRLVAAAVAALWVLLGEMIQGQQRQGMGVPMKMQGNGKTDGQENQNLVAAAGRDGKKKF